MTRKSPRWTPPPASDRPLRERASIDAWHAAIVALAARHGFDAGGATPFATGSDVVFGDAVRVYKLGEPCWREQAERERRWLAYVHGRLDVATPGLVAAGEFEGWPYTIMSRVEGTALSDVWPRLDPDARVRLAARIGELVASLHAMPTPVGEPAWEPFAHEAVDAARALRRAEVECGAVPAALVDDVEAFLASFGADVAVAAAQGFGDDRRVPLHTELLGAHVLVTDDADPRPCGVIDWADARVGPPGYDVPALVEFVFTTDLAATRAFLVAWAPRAEDRARQADALLAWALCHRYARLSRLVRAAGGDATLAAIRASLFGA